MFVEYLKLFSAALLNVALVVGVYTLDKRTKFKEIKRIYKELIIGVIFGASAIYASNFGVKIWGATMNVRDASPISAGLIFGPIAGVVAGALGGGFRALTVIWNPASAFTVVACSVSTFLAGVFAAILRKFMFDDKKPNWIWAIGLTIVLEVFHMLMILITNLDDTYNAFLFVRECTMPMIFTNAVSVGLSITIVSILSKEKLFKVGKEKGISQAFQRWLILSILIAFASTSIFTFNLQTDMREKQIQETFKSAIVDVIGDIEGKSDSTLLATAEAVKEEYLSDTSKSLTEILSLQDFNGKIADISLISKEGIVQFSTDARNLENGGFNFNDSDQAKEFMILAGAEEGTWHVQSYQKNGFDEMKKYAGITLPSDESVPESIRGGIIQVSYNSAQFRKNIDKFVVDFTKNRSVGTNGFVAVCDEEFKLVTETKRNGKDLSIIGIDREKNEELRERKSASKIYTTQITNDETDYNEKYLYVFTFAEEYCIIATIPQAEAMLIRDASIYLSVYMQVIVFGVLFIIMYFLIKKLIVDNIHKINGTLSKISSGNLNETVDVRTNVEFASLSDDINSTVDTLKRYIREAAARIDKELEYAKQIQLSALPNIFPSEKDFEIRAEMIAAKEVGGDFYDFYKLNDNLVAFLVADVSGKGIPAAMFMMTAKTIIKDLAERGLAVNEILTKANEKLCENNESGMFVTAWMGILDLSNGKLTFANAGHNPPLICKNGKFEYLKSRAGLVLAGMEGVKYRINEIQLQKDDRIFLYTDGVTEATDSNTQLYGEQRLLSFMNDNVSVSATEILPKLKADIDMFVGQAPQFDDITMLVLDYKKEAQTVVEKILPAKEEKLAELLGFVEENLEKYDCPLKSVMAICVAIEEVFVNVAHYAYEGGEGDVKFTIGFDEELREITFTMYDNGVPFDPLAKADPDVTLSASERQIGGLGIFITKKTMDKVLYRYENGQNILTMIRKI